MAKTKTKILRIRVSQKMYDFLQMVSKTTGLDNISELVRAVLEYFYIGYMMGEWKKVLKKFPKSKNKK